MGTRAGLIGLDMVGAQHMAVVLCDKGFTRRINPESLAFRLCDARWLGIGVASRRDGLKGRPDPI